MNLMLSVLLLCLAPVIQLALMLTALLFLNDFRQGFGAGSGVTAATYVALAIVALMHAGYMLAPILVFNGRANLTLWLMSAGAMVGLVLVLACVFYIVTRSDFSNVADLVRYGGTAVGLFVLYSGPLFLVWMQRR